MELKEIISKMSEEEKIRLYNVINKEEEICNNTYGFLECWFSDNLYNLVDAVKEGDYNINDKYVVYNSDACLISFNNLADFISDDKIVEILLDYKNTYNSIIEIIKKSNIKEE